MPSLQVGDEKEMSDRLRRMVDNCFEEGHYEAGIALLKDLRSPTKKPSVSHILQLILIAMYPPPPPEPSAAVTTATPKKLQDRQKALLIPSEQAARDAILLLDSFVNTNKPWSITEGLPRYPNPQASSAPATEDRELLRFSRQGSAYELEDSSSFTAKGALEIAQAKDFWSCLGPMFITRPENRTQEDDDWEKEADDANPIGPYAWPVLEWFIRVVEKDEELYEKKYSRILLYQIPAPRTGVGPRWETTSVLGVILDCFQQEPSSTQGVPEHREQLGSRLLNSLINLTTDGALSSPQLLRELCSAFDGVEPALMSSMIGQINSAQSHFKMALCAQYLSRLSDSEQDQRQQIRDKKPKPRARVADATGQLQTEVQQVANATRIEPLSSAEVMKLLVLPFPVLEGRPRFLCAKFHLLVTYGQLCRSAPTADWRASCSSYGGQPSPLRAAVQQGFSLEAVPSPLDDMEKSWVFAADALVTMWEKAAMSP